MAVTDEKTGEMPTPVVLAGFMLQDVGGPILDERPDPIRRRTVPRLQRSEEPRRSDRQLPEPAAEQAPFAVGHADGERVYVAGTTAGFYALDTEAISSNSNAAIAGGTAKCNRRSTIAAVDGVIDPAKLPDIANDCIPWPSTTIRGRRRFSPGARRRRQGAALSGPADQVALRRLSSGQRAADRHPQRGVRSGSSGARPQQHEARPAYVWLTDENGGCPLNYARMVSGI